MDVFLAHSALNTLATPLRWQPHSISTRPNRRVWTPMFAVLLCEKTAAVQLMRLFFSHSPQRCILLAVTAYSITTYSVTCESPLGYLTPQRTSFLEQPLHYIYCTSLSSTSQAPHSPSPVPISALTLKEKTCCTAGLTMAFFCSNYPKC